MTTIKQQIENILNNGLIEEYKPIMGNKYQYFASYKLGYKVGSRTENVNWCKLDDSMECNASASEDLQIEFKKYLLAIDIQKKIDKLDLDNDNALESDNIHNILNSKQELDLQGLENLNEIMSNSNLETKLNDMLEKFQGENQGLDLEALKKALKEKNLGNADLIQEPVGGNQGANPPAQQPAGGENPGGENPGEANPPVQNLVGGENPGEANIQNNAENAVGRANIQPPVQNLVGGNQEAQVEEENVVQQIAEAIKIEFPKECTKEEIEKVNNSAKEAFKKALVDTKKIEDIHANTLITNVFGQNVIEQTNNGWKIGLGLTTGALTLASGLTLLSAVTTVPVLTPIITPLLPLVTAALAVNPVVALGVVTGLCLVSFIATCAFMSNSKITILGEKFDIKDKDQITEKLNHVLDTFIKKVEEKVQVGGEGADVLEVKTVELSKEQIEAVKNEVNSNWQQFKQKQQEEANGKDQGIQNV